MRLPRLEGSRTRDDGVRAWPTMAGGEGLDVALLGSWSATRWQYAGKARHEQLVDVVTGLKGSVTMSLSAGAYVVTWDTPGRGSGSVGGSVTIADGELHLRPHGADAIEVVRYKVAGHTLALGADLSAWDFDGGEDEPAEFIAVLVRL